MASVAYPLRLVSTLTVFRQASCVGGRAAPRRVFLCLGTFFLDNFRRMASNSVSRFLTSSARPQKGVSPVEQVLQGVQWPEKFPLKDEDFSRFDESLDSLFYSEPRFVTHIDDPAISALTKYYQASFPPSNTPGVCLLDLCSSWVSHYPAGYRQERIVGMGMNEDELKQNQILTEYIVQDLNVNPKLPFEDNSFDVITNVVSVDYLIKPIDVFKEMERVLKPAGLAIIRLWIFRRTRGVQTQCTSSTREREHLLEDVVRRSLCIFSNPNRWDFARQIVLVLKLGCSKWMLWVSNGVFGSCFQVGPGLNDFS